MLSSKTTLACAFALISSVSAGLIPADVLGIPITPVALLAGIIPVSPDSSGSCPTGYTLTPVSSSSIVPAAIGNVVPAVVPAGKVASAVVGSSASDGMSFPAGLLPGFSSSIELSCRYGDIIVSPKTNGIEVPVSQAASAPYCSTSPGFHGEHILIIIGPDINGAQTLQFVQPGEVSSDSSKSSSVSFSSPETAAVKYLGPESSEPCEYTIFLFLQPEDFELSDFSDSDRYGFDIADFADKHALGVPVAGIFFVSGSKDASGYGTHSNGTYTGKSHNGNSKNGTLHGSSHHGNGTSNSTTYSSNNNGTSTNTNSSSSASPSALANPSLAGGNVPVPPNAVPATKDSLSGATAYVANFALAGFVTLVSVGIMSL